MDRNFSINSNNSFDYFQLFGSNPIFINKVLLIEIRKFTYQVTPFCGKNDIDAIKSIFRKRLAIGIRYFSPVTEDKNGDIINAFVLFPPYSFESLSSKARNQTRRGLENVDIEKLPFSQNLERELFSVYAENASRLNLFRSEKKLRARWKKWCNVLYKSKEVDLWIASKNKNVLAFCVILRFNNSFAEVMLHRSSNNGLKLYPNNALVFTIGCYYFENNFKALSYGLESFDKNFSGLDHFKKNMGFIEVSYFQYFKLNPFLRLFEPFLKIKAIRKIFSMFGY